MAKKIECSNCGKSYDPEKRSTCPLCRFDPESQQLEGDRSFVISAGGTDGIDFFQLNTAMSKSPDSSDKTSQENGVPGSQKSERDFERRVGTPSAKRNASLGFDMYDLVRSQDRTTHAIRSLAIFFFVNLTAGVFGSTLMWLGITFDQLFLTAIGALVVIVGFVFAIIGGIEELSQSGRGLD